VNRGERRALERAREKGFDVFRAPVNETDPKTGKVVWESAESTWHTGYPTPRKYDARGQYIGTKKKYRSVRPEFIPPTIPADQYHGGDAIEVSLDPLNPEVPPVARTAGPTSEEPAGPPPIQARTVAEALEEARRRKAEREGQA
jgi:hypothetical protein